MRITIPVILGAVLITINFSCRNETEKTDFDNGHEKILKEYRAIDSIGTAFLLNIGYKTIPSNNGKKLDELYLYTKDTLDYIFIHATFVNRLNENNHPEDALVLLKKISPLIKRNDRSDYYYNVALNFSEIKQFDEADIAFFDSALVNIDRAINIDSLNSEFYFLKSRIHDAKSDFSSAIFEINFAIKLAPKNLRFINQRGYYEALNGNFKSALEDLKNTYSDFENPEFIFFSRSLSHFGLLNFKQALLEINDYFKLGGKDPLGYYIRGYSKYSLKGDTFGLGDIRISERLGNEYAKEFLKNYSKKL